MWCKIGETEIDLSRLVPAENTLDGDQDKEYLRLGACTGCVRDWGARTATLGRLGLAVLTTRSELTEEEIMECQVDSLS